MAEKAKQDDVAENDAADKVREDAENIADKMIRKKAGGGELRHDGRIPPPQLC